MPADAIGGNWSAGAVVAGRFAMAHVSPEPQEYRKHGDFGWVGFESFRLRRWLALCWRFAPTAHRQIGQDHQARGSGAARRLDRRDRPADGRADRLGAGRHDRGREPAGRERHDRHRAGVARGPRRHDAADDREHLSHRCADPEGELPSGHGVRPDLLPGAVARGVRGQQCVAVPEPEGHAGRCEGEARRIDHGGGRSRLDVPDGLYEP